MRMMQRLEIGFADGVPRSVLLHAVIEPHKRRNLTFVAAAGRKAAVDRLQRGTVHGHALDGGRPSWDRWRALFCNKRRISGISGARLMAPRPRSTLWLKATK